MHVPLYILALVAYSAAAALRIARWGNRSWVPRAAWVSAVVGVLAHLGAISSLAVVAGGLPISGPGDSVALIAGGIGIGTLLVRPKERGEVLSGVLSSLAAVMLGVALLLPSQAVEPNAGLAQVFFPLHALATFVGLSCFALAFGVSVMFLVVRRRLKAKQLSGLGGLPSMEALDTLNTQTVAVGFLSLTLGIAAGGAWAASVGSTGLGAVVWITLVLWGWYAVAVLVRVVGGWRGKLSAQLSVMGFVGMLISLGAIVGITQGWHP
ncbi:MAG: cytochrome c biogenesis protein CcsA [Myxococcota bacterium]|nr:cytochrome c biogenesis protein CcsA [Myxococcota bacterium]